MIRGAGVALAIGVWAGGGGLVAEQAAKPAVQAVDHLLLGVADLDAGIAWVEQLTGVRAVPGGSHPGRGTRNALLALGARRYLEIIAPDPAQATFNYEPDLRTFKEPHLINWAAAATDIQAVAAAARTAGQQAFGPNDGSRARPDGRVLRWRVLGLRGDLAAGGVNPIPFFIEWSADSLHPSADSPAGCDLRAFEIVHPKPGDVADTLAHVGINATVTPGSAQLRATLRCPRGAVELR
jgi:hypothetical protein